MAQDRYVKGTLTLIAAALVYLCAIVTPWPAALAQNVTKPGEIVGPMEVVIVGWKVPPDQPLPVTVPQPMAVNVQNTVPVRGRVQTERSDGRADRVVLVGWEQRGAVEPNPTVTFRSFDAESATTALPTMVVPR